MSLASEQSRAIEYRVRPHVSSLHEKHVMERLAAARLRKAAYPEVRRLVCEFHEGMLCLRGRVPSYFLKQVAQTAVMEMDGVDEIHNQLEVDFPPDGR